MRKDFNARVYGYVVMPAHVHLLISEPDHHTLARRYALPETLLRQETAHPIRNHTARTLLAGARLRSQHPQRQRVRRETRLHSQQSGEARPRETT